MGNFNGGMNELMRQAARMQRKADGWESHDAVLAMPPGKGGDRSIARPQASPNKPLGRHSNIAIVRR